MAECIEREAALAFQNEVEPLLCRNVVTQDIMSATKDADLVKHLQSIPAADAIEELQTTLCNWCAVCPRDKRDLSTCEIYESCRAKSPKEE